MRRRLGSGVDQRISEETEQVAPEAVVAASMSHGPFPPCRRPNRTPKPGPDSPLSPRATVILEPHRLPNRFPTLAQQKPRLPIREAGEGGDLRVTGPDGPGPGPVGRAVAILGPKGGNDLGG